MKNIFHIVVLLSLIFFTCKSKGGTHTSSNNDSVQHTMTNDSMITPPVYEENIFRAYDAARQILNDWNNAINNNNLVELEKLYHDTVNYHETPQPLHYRMQLQKKHQSINPGYKQDITNIEIYNLDEDTLPLRITAEFELIVRVKNFRDTVKTLLTFEKIMDEWKIVGETDVRSIEFEAMNKPNTILKKGSYTFSRGYWADTRQEQGFAHDQVPYNFVISIQISDSITGNANAYSGRMRENTEYLIPEGKMENGMLELVTIWNGDYESSLEDYDDGNISKNRIERWTFKIIDAQHIYGVNCNAYVQGFRLTGMKE